MRHCYISLGTFLMLFTINVSFAQKDTINYSLQKGSFLVGTSFSYFFDDEYGEGYTELLMNNRVSFFPIKKFTAGINTLFIRANADEIDPQSYYFFGPFLQYKFSGSRNVLFYIESGYYFSNYEATVDDEIIHNNKMRYLSLGGGFNIKLMNKLYFDFGFIPQGRIDNLLWGIGLNYYRIGIEYYIPTLK